MIQTIVSEEGIQRNRKKTKTLNNLHNEDERGSHHHPGDVDSMFCVITYSLYFLNLSDQFSQRHGTCNIVLTFKSP